MKDGKTRANIKPGMLVNIVLKKKTNVVGH